MYKPSKRVIAAAAAVAITAAAAGAAVTVTGAAADASVPHISFQMVVSKGAAACMPGALAKVTIESQGPVEVMKISAAGLPPDTDFDLFTIQVPNAPFGLAVYQGDLESDRTGHAHGKFIGRFNIETFVVAPGAAPAPVVFNNAFPDASSNPPTNPVQLYHLGLWFNSPQDAKAAGCPAAVTPFNGEHDAGIQALNTSNFPINAGPLFLLK
jgi:hypothetical protein